MGRFLRSFVFVVVILGIWQFYCVFFEVPRFILPSPQGVFDVVVGQWRVLLSHSWVTLSEILLGIFCALALALPLAGLMFSFSWFERAFTPFLVASQAVPVFALAPLLVVWFGYGIASKVFMATIIIFFPIVVSVLDGLKSCDQGYVGLFRSMGASRWKRFRMLYFPCALPSLFSGLRIGVSVATIGAVIGEWVGAQKGLGYLMIQSNARMRVDVVFASILFLTFMGLVLWAFVGFLERKFVYWR